MRVASRVAVVVACALASGCGPSAACLDRCAQLGMDDVQCTRVCTTSCAELRETYGVSEETCRELHDGPAE